MDPRELVEEYVIERWLKAVPLEQRPPYEEIRRLLWLIEDLIVAK